MMTLANLGTYKAPLKSLNNPSLLLCMISAHVGFGRFTLGHMIGIFILID
jgi:hypothetical protein